MKAKINIDTVSAINQFVNICSTLKCPVHLTDGSQYTVSAKSLLGSNCNNRFGQKYTLYVNRIFTHILKSF